MLLHPQLQHLTEVIKPLCAIQENWQVLKQAPRTLRLRFTECAEHWFNFNKEMPSQQWLSISVQEASCWIVFECESMQGCLCVSVSVCVWLRVDECVLACFSSRLLALCLMGFSGGWTTASLLLCPAVPQPLDSHQLQAKGRNAHTRKHLPDPSPSLLLMQDERAELLLTAATVTRCWRKWRSSSDAARAHFHIGTLFCLFKNIYARTYTHTSAHTHLLLEKTHMASSDISYTLHTPAEHRQLSNSYHSPWNIVTHFPGLTLFVIGRHVALWFVIGSNQKNSRSKESLSLALLLPSSSHTPITATHRHACSVCPLTRYFITLRNILSFQRRSNFLLEQTCHPHI